MVKSRALLPIAFVILMAIYVHAQTGDDEGVADDPNHPRTVDVMRENNRINKEFLMVSSMLIAIFDDKEYAEDFGEFSAKTEKKNFKISNDAWESYRQAELNLETQLYGTTPSGYPGQERYYKCDTELTRERITRMRKFIEKIYKDEKYQAPNGNLTLKIKGMLEKITEMEAEESKKMRK